LRSLGTKVCLIAILSISTTTSELFEHPNMLSNPTNNLHNRQRHHRRQQSTPSAYEPVKVAILPNYPRHGSHRRGMSLDTRRRNTPPQDLSISHTNQGYTTHLQHNLRETQQQRPIRPGPSPCYQNFDHDENYLRSPAVTPQRQYLDIGQTYEQQNVYLDPVITPTNVNFFEGNPDYTIMNHGLVMTPSTQMSFPHMENFESHQGRGSRPSSGRRISGGIQGRVAQFEQLALKSPQRPETPPSQNAIGM
jgi:regulatory protein SWI5